MSQPQSVKTEIYHALDPAAAKAGIARAAVILKAGGVVAFPTETVYGLGANALDPAAVRKIFAAKGRPADNPLIVHLAEAAQMDALAQNIPAEARLLAEKFWPGPLTLVLEKKPCVPAETTGGLESVALRVPAHPAALALLQAAGLPVAAPSANLSGRPSPTTARHVLQDMSGRIDAVLDGGPCGVGVESTVLDIRGGRPLLLRPGGVTPEEIEQVLGRPCPVAAWLEESSEAPPSPGLKYVHYAPQAPLWLIRGLPEAVLRKMKEMQAQFHSQGKAVGLLLSAQHAGEFAKGRIEVLGNRHEPAVLAANLYSALRRFDESGVDVILAEGYAEEGLGLALMNRMGKAAGPRVLDVE